MTAAQLLLTLFTPPDEAGARRLYAMGQADGRAWACQQGWPGACA
jgi:hypothetical protein